MNAPNPGSAVPGTARANVPGSETPAGVMRAGDAASTNLPSSEAPSAPESVTPATARAKRTSVRALAGISLAPYVGLAMRALAFILGIVVVAVGCDKTGGDAPAPEGPAFEMDSNPDLVFYVFGEREDARMMPLLTLRDRSPAPINLDNAGWLAFDERYFRPGLSYPTYRDGRPAGTVTVQRGMWEGGEPLYALAGCSNLIPMAAVTLSDTTGGGIVVSQYATTRPDSTGRPRPTLSGDSIRAIARLTGVGIGATVDITQNELDSLDFRAIAIATGALESPTIVVSFVDPRGGDLGPGRGHLQHVFGLADDSGTGYAASYSHSVNGDATSAEVRGFVDHLDLNGDGVSEVFVDASRPGTETTTRVLAWRAGAWQEVFSTRQSWCLR